MTSNEHARKSSAIEVLYQASISSFLPRKSAYDAEMCQNLVKAFHLSMFLEVTVPSTKLMVISNLIDDRTCYLEDYTLRYLYLTELLDDLSPSVCGVDEE